MITHLTNLRSAMISINISIPPIPELAMSIDQK